MVSYRLSEGLEYIGVSQRTERASRPPKNRQNTGSTNENPPAARQTNETTAQAGETKTEKTPKQVVFCI